MPTCPPSSPNVWAKADEAIMTAATIICYPVIPWWLLLSLLPAGLWMVWRTCPLDVSGGWSRGLLLATRMLALLIMAWLLLQPERRSVRLELEPPTLAVAIDVSASMTERLGDNSRSRAENAMQLLESREFARAAADYRLAVFEIGEELAEVGADWSELHFLTARSNLHRGLNRIVERLRNENLAGLLFLSDGLDHSGEVLDPRLYRVPILIPALEKPVAAETDEPREDVYFAEVSYPSRLVLGWQGDLEILLRRRGERPLSVPLSLSEDGELRHREIVDFAEGESFRRLRLPLAPERVGALPLKLELDLEDGRQGRRRSRELMIEVVEAEGRILYLEGAPRWEFRFFRQALQSEPDYDLLALARGVDGGFVSFDQSDAPIMSLDLSELRGERLRDYSLIVLGDLPASALSVELARDLRDFVERGGGMLLLGGRQALGKHGLLALPDLNALSPVDSRPESGMAAGRFPVDFTASGRVHPGLRDWAESATTPPVLSLWRPVEIREIATSLAAAPGGDPVVAVRRYGAGRVAVILSDSLWRWQLDGASVPGQDKSLYDLFVVRLVQWLAPAERDFSDGGILQVLTERLEYEQGQTVLVGAIMGQPDLSWSERFSCLVVGPDGRRRELAMASAMLEAEVGLRRELPGLRGRFVAASPGRYRIVANLSDPELQAETEILVVEPERELTGEPMARENLRALAETSGGGFAEKADWDELWSTLAYEPEKTMAVSETPIWNRGFWLFAVLLLLCFQWWWRRRIGLV